MNNKTKQLKKLAQEIEDVKSDFNRWVSELLPQGTKVKCDIFKPCDSFVGYVEMVSPFGNSVLIKSKNNSIRRWVPTKYLEIQDEEE